MTYIRSIQNTSTSHSINFQNKQRRAGIKISIDGITVSTKNDEYENLLEFYPTLHGLINALETIKKHLEFYDD